MASENRPTDSDSDTKFNAWVIGAEKHSSKLGLRAGLWKEIYIEDSDWAFVLKIDSLLETVCRGIVTRCLRMLVNDKPTGESGLEEFVTDLPVRGWVSLSRLLKISGCPTEHIAFIEAVRTVRNCYAHDISMIERSLIELVTERNDRSSLLRALMPIDVANFDEAVLLPVLTSEPRMLRYGILCEGLRFLTFSYIVIHANKSERDEIKRAFEALKAPAN